jgi:hypothetical protein
VRHKPTPAATRSAARELLILLQPKKLVAESRFRDQMGAKTGLCSLQTTQMTPNNSYRKELNGQNRQR